MPSVVSVVNKKVKNRAQLTTTIDPAGLYKLSSFLPLTGYARSSWHAQMGKGLAPKPAVKVTPRRPLWRGADILTWLEDPTTYKDRVAAGQDGCYPSLEKYVA